MGRTHPLGRWRIGQWRIEAVLMIVKRTEITRNELWSPTRRVAIMAETNGLVWSARQLHHSIIVQLVTGALRLYPRPPTHRQYLRNFSLSQSVILHAHWTCVVFGRFIPGRETQVLKLSGIENCDGFVFSFSSSSMSKMFCSSDGSVRSLLAVHWGHTHLSGKSEASQGGLQHVGWYEMGHRSQQTNTPPSRHDSQYSLFFFPFQPGRRTRSFKSQNNQSIDSNTVSAKVLFWKTETFNCTDRVLFCPELVVQ